jgi:hypothetical protein
MRSCRVNLVQSLARVVNLAVQPLAAAGRLGRSMTVVSYTGRKSGRRFSLPVAYKRSGDELTITVEMPGQKAWWRNFLGEGGPMEIRVEGTDRTGHAVARPGDRGRVTVLVRLDQPGAVTG